MTVNIKKAAELKEREQQNSTRKPVAEETSKSEYVYPSNLSAALYEIGDYAGCRDAIFRAWNLMGPKPDQKVGLRLSTRLAKALSYCARQTPETSDAQDMIGKIRTMPQDGTPDPENQRAWKIWDEVCGERQRVVDGGKDALARFSVLPVFRRTVDPTLEFYKIGQDPPLSIIHFWDPQDKDPMNLKTLSKKNLSELAFLFGGVGDARHVFGSLTGLYQAYQDLNKEKRSKFKVHLTLLDIQPAALTRDLLMFMLIDELVSNDFDKETEAEIQACLLYVFFGTVMPSYCFARLQKIIKNLRKGLSNDPPRLPSYIHVDAATIPVILNSLEYLDNFPPSLTAKGILKYHGSPDAGAGMQDPMLSGLIGGLFEDRKKTRRAQASKMLDSMSPDQLKATGLSVPGVPASQLKKYMTDNREKMLDLLMEADDDKAAKGSTPEEKEKAWYKDTNSFALPALLRQRHPGYEDALRSAGKAGQHSTKQVQKIRADVAETWKPNLTFFDRASQEHSGFNPGGYPVISVAFFLQLEMFGAYNKYMGLKPMNTSGKDDGYAYTIMSTFFNAVVVAMKGMSHRVKLEFLLGELTGEMSKMRYGGDVSRPADFPRSYTRIWLSNVPDYTHGPMNVATLSIPNLQDLPDASVASNCLLNTSMWQSDDVYCHSYTLLPIRDVPRILGSRVTKMKAFFGTIIMGGLSTPRPLPELASRTELTTWLTRVFLNTILPPCASASMMTARCPNNLVAFVHLLFHLHSVGFPAHWLSEYVQSLLTERLVTDIAPYGRAMPIPLSYMQMRVPRRAVRTDPWLAELETLFATAYEGLPFPVRLPAGFASSAADIAVFEARIEGAPAASPWGGGRAPMQPTTSLLFYKPSRAYSPNVVVRNLPMILENKAGPPNGEIQILTAQETVDVPNHVVRWRMSKRRAERMVEEVILPVLANDWKESLYEYFSLMLTARLAYKFFQPPSLERARSASSDFLHQVCNVQLSRQHGVLAQESAQVNIDTRGSDLSLYHRLHRAPAEIIDNSTILRISLQRRRTDSRRLLGSDLTVDFTGIMDREAGQNARSVLTHGKYRLSYSPFARVGEFCLQKTLALTSSSMHGLSPAASGAHPNFYNTYSAYASRNPGSGPQADITIPPTALLSHVCTHWREVCLNDCRLWTTIVADNRWNSRPGYKVLHTGKWPSEFMARSGDAPLNVDIDISKSDTLGPLVLNHIHHSRSLGILGSEQGGLDAFLASLANHAAPMLEYLSIRGEGDLTRFCLPPTVFANTAPRLRTLKLVRIRLPPSSIPAFNHLASIHANGIIGVQDIWQLLLPRLSHVKTLELSHIYPDPVHMPDPFSPSERLHALDLSTFVVYEADITCLSKLLASLDAPSLSQLNIIVMYYNTLITCMTAFIRTLSPHIRVLRQRHGPIREVAINAMQVACWPNYNEDRTHGHSTSPFSLEWTIVPYPIDAVTLIGGILTAIPVDDVRTVSFGSHPWIDHEQGQGECWPCLYSLPNVAVLQISYIDPSVVDVLCILQSLTPPGERIKASLRNKLPLQDRILLPHLTKLVFVGMHSVRAHGGLFLRLLSRLAQIRRLGGEPLEIVFERCYYSADVMVELKKNAVVAWDGTWCPPFSFGGAGEDPELENWESWGSLFDQQSAQS
ncbi:hypothetical protein EVG20_g469 [Dentipellis fragilis]|uniref:DUF4470 domain-containing protein n=1 Tax=Dentipellis fragilis TaxID=205917 RepID=A0A4Y9ZD81_9AGAM|nr:hypothetical protein EVG20_g469 [Dentipellis fragilis]